MSLLGNPLVYTHINKLFSFTLFSEELDTFMYWPDNQNKPCSIEKENFIRRNIRLSSGGMLSLLRFFRSIVGNFYPEMILFRLCM